MNTVSGDDGGEYNPSNVLLRNVQQGNLAIHADTCNVPAEVAFSDHETLAVSYTRHLDENVLSLFLPRMK